MDACRYFGGAAGRRSAGRGQGNAAVAALFAGCRLVGAGSRCAPEIDEIAGGFLPQRTRSEIIETNSGQRSNPPAGIVGSGYVVKSLEAALWAFHPLHRPSATAACWQ